MVLVSEVMLQQTQASRVLLYFSEWMSLFPSFEALSKAPEEAVIKAWEGLGYYSRARSLHKAAKVIVEEYKGAIPQNKDDLLSIPGIGPYTAGAILSFAFHKRALAIDANVERVVRRLHAIPYADKEAKKRIELFTDSLLPQKDAWHTMEALIELGALICQKKPSCETCPVSALCASYKRGWIESPPPKPKTTKLFRDVACFIANEQILVLHRTGKQIMSGLHEFPFFDSIEEGRSRKSLHTLLEKELSFPFTIQEKLPCITHSFTRFRSHLYPWIISVPSIFPWPDGTWVSLDALSTLPFSSGHKRICSMIPEYLPEMSLVGCQL